jgi:outer membrane protein TolC
MIGPILAAAALGSVPITLQEVRELSRRNTPERLQELQYLISTEQQRTAVSSIYPQLSFGSDATRTLQGTQRTYVSVPTGALDPATGRPIFVQSLGDQTGLNRNTFGVNAQLTQLLFDGGKWWNQIAQAGALEDAAIGQTKEQRFTSEYEGIRRFYALLVAQATLDVLKATETRSREQVERASALYEAGRSPKSDVIQAEVNLGNDRINAILQVGTIGNSQSDLAIWIAHSGIEELVAVEPPGVRGKPAPAPALEGAVKTAREKRPLLKALEQQRRASDLGVAVARSGYWPTLYAQANYIRQGPDAATVYSDPSRQNTFNFGLHLTWNLFSGFATLAAVNTALYNRSTAELNLQQATYEVEGDIRRYLRALEAEIDATSVARDNLKSSQDNLTLAQERFKAGAGSTLEVRDAQLKLTQAELTLIQNRVSVETVRANLERVMGVYE